MHLMTHVGKFLKGMMVVGVDMFEFGLELDSFLS